jgi:muramoyltetrapeptide carboxypeptidase
MMMSLKRSGKLDQLAGLIVGEFTAIRSDVEDTFNLPVEEIIWDKIKEYNYPVCFHFPAGHITENRALKMGRKYELTVGRETTNLVEMHSAPAPVNVNIFQS